MGSPVAVMVGNTEWPKWEQVMAADPVDPEILAALARNAPLTRPRPGHADLAGMQKYGFDEARPVLERASARETAARVALGAVARSYLKETAGHRDRLARGGTRRAPRPRTASCRCPADVARLDADPVRCLDADASKAMVAEIDQAHKDGDTLGGVVEVLAYGVPVGLGSHVHWDRRLDARLAGALMGIQAIKGVELGDGFDLARVPGSQAHDEIVLDRRRHPPRLRPLRRHRGRPDHRRTAAGAGRDEADRHRAARAGHRRREPPARPPRPTTSAPTCARCRPPASSPRRWSPWCWPTRWPRSSAATTSPRPGAT